MQFLLTASGFFIIFSSDDQGILYNKDKTSLCFVPEGFEGTYTLPASVTEVDGIFYNSSKLGTIEVEQGNSAYFSFDGMLYSFKRYGRDQDKHWNDIYYCTENNLIACPPARELGSYTIPAETGFVEIYAFGNCLGLTELTVPATCPVGVGSSGFYDIVFGCANLKAVWFEDGNPSCISDENGFVYNAKNWYTFTTILCDRGEALLYVPAAYSGDYLEIREGVVAIEGTIEAPGLKAIRFPSTLWTLESNILVNSSVEWLLFTGELPLTSFQDDPWATGLHADLYYPDWEDSWKVEYKMDEDSTYVNYIPYEQGKEPVWSGDSPFKDVPVGSFFAEPVAWAVETGVTAGLTATAFGPNSICNRAQIVTFLYRAYNK